MVSNYQTRPPIVDSSNAYDIFIEAFILFLAGALGMLLPLLAVASGSVGVYIYIYDYIVS